MNKLVKIKDNSSIEKDEFSGVKSIIEKIKDRTLKQLKEDKIFVFPEVLEEIEDLSSEQMVIQTINDKYYSTNVMGFLGYKDERLIIESRFSKDNKEDYFFQYLLYKVLDIPNIVDFKTDYDKEDKLFNYLLFLFPYYLKNAMRKGLFKEYICHKYNDESIKGTIDIARHIKNNTPFLGKVAYNQREFSYDNSLMELIRHTIEFIKTKSFGNNLLFKVKDEVSSVIYVTEKYKLFDRQKIIEDNIKNTIHHAYFREYLLLQRLCILILRNQRHIIGTGLKQIYGILFDGAWLWEEYVNILINKNNDKFYHPKNKSKENHQWLFDNSTGKIYPDFISKDSNNRIIADAKYKPINNINGHDYFQVLAYMFRFDSKTGYYLYPEKDNNGDKCLYLNHGVGRKAIKREDIKVIKHGLKIPQDSKNYNEFVKEIEQNEKIFVERILK